MVNRYGKAQGRYKFDVSSAEPMTVMADGKGDEDARRDHKAEPDFGRPGGKTSAQSAHSDKDHQFIGNDPFFEINETARKERADNDRNC